MFEYHGEGAVVGRRRFQRVRVDWEAVVEIADLKLVGAVTDATPDGFFFRVIKCESEGRWLDAGLVDRFVGEGSTVWLSLRSGRRLMTKVEWKGQSEQHHGLGLGLRLLGPAHVNDRALRAIWRARDALTISALRFVLQGNVGSLQPAKAVASLLSALPLYGRFRERP